MLEVLEPRRLCATTSPTPAPLGLTPQQVRHAYGFDQATFVNAAGKTVAADGRGQTIAIVSAFHAPNIAKDLRQFDKTLGLPDRVPGGGFVLRTAMPQGRPGVDASWANETSMDVEWAHAIAPAAKILLVEAKSESQADLFDAVDFARRQRGVVAVSMSWGWDMTDAPPASLYAPIITTPANHVGGYRKGDGVTFVEASGDDGVADTWPDASVPIVSVGGTMLSLDPAGNYAGETALAQSVSSSTVSYNAAPSPGFAMYDTTPLQGVQGWQTGDGTSAGAPQWAALIAIADQGRALARRHSLDGPAQVLPALQTLPPSDFHVISGGTAATGRGSPIADRLIHDLVSLD